MSARDKANPTGPEAIDARLRLAERDIDRQIDWNRKTDEGLGGLKAGQEELSSKVDGVVTELGRARKAFKDLADTVTAMAKKPAEGEEEEKEPSFSWITADDRDVAAEKLAELERWLAQVLVHYPDGVLPDCWRRHAWQVEELFCLMDGYQLAYAPGAGPGGRLDWHNRWRPEVMKRIGAGWKGCGLLQHLRNPAEYPVPRQVGIDDPDPIAAWWATTHGASPDPAPSPAAEAEAQSRSKMSSTFN